MTEDLKFKLPLKQDDTCGNIIWTADRQRFCDLRGWGYLTGTDGLRLSEEEAERIQDARGKLIVDAVNSYAQLQTENAELLAENERLTKERDEAINIAKEAYDIGSKQADEWDRYWTALGIATEDITVDDAIERYKKMETAMYQASSFAEQFDDGDNEATKIVASIEDALK